MRMPAPPITVAARSATVTTRAAPASKRAVTERVAVSTPTSATASTATSAAAISGAAAPRVRPVTTTSPIIMAALVSSWLLSCSRNIAGTWIWRSSSTR